jgi:hypothetical protein
LIITVKNSIPVIAITWDTIRRLYGRILNRLDVPKLNAMVI